MLIMNKQYILIIFLAIVTLASCKKESVNLYDDIARIQFGQEEHLLYKPEFDLSDTVKNKTFVYDAPEVTRDTIYFDIYTLGKVSDQDRTFSLKQEEVPGANNAVAGKHYVGFDDPEAKSLFVIKGGTAHLRVPIIVLRDASLKDGAVELKIVVAADDNFQPGEPTKIWRRVGISDQLIQPATWINRMVPYFGDYSTVKHQFMIDVTGQKWDEAMFQEFMASISMMNYYRTVVKTALVDYNNQHPQDPLKDEFGDLVVFP